MDRDALRTALERMAPWILDPTTGPAAVDAGECQRCGRQPRWVSTCGPQPWAQVCRDCVLDLGTDAFCAGHHDDALEHVAAAQALPDDWATIVRLAWVATGEVRPDPTWIRLVVDEVADRRLAAALVAR